MPYKDGCYYERVGALHQMSGREIADKLRQEGTSEAEYRSWVNSAPLLVDVIHRAGLDGLTLALEYPTPIGGRIDAVLLGRRRADGKPLALVVELKQWSGIGENTMGWESYVPVRIGAAFEDRPHPVQQTLTYAKHLRANHSGVAGGRMEVRCCQYLHNFEDKDRLFQGSYQSYAPLRHETYAKGEEEALEAYLRDIFSPEPDPDAAEQFLGGTYVFGQAGFDALRRVFNREENLVMIDDQVEINKKVHHILEDLRGGDGTQKLVVISGPPGTGKTVVGMHIIYSYCTLFRAAGRRQGGCVFSLPRSRTLSEVIAGASGLAPVYLDRVPEGRDLVVVDEAHRIEDLDRVMAGLVEKARVIVMLQDDRQRIRLTEEGTLENFRRFAQGHGIELVSGSLASQKRAGRLGSYVSDLDRLLYDRWDRPIPRQSILELSHWDSLRALDRRLHQLAAGGRHVKWYAPFCWPWSRSAGHADISIPQADGAFEKAWNPAGEQYRWYVGGRDEDLDRVGCIYTAQGLEFDDIGVIWWDDLRWDPQAGDWRVDLDKSCDSRFVRSIAEHFGGRLRGGSPPWLVLHNGAWKDMPQFLRDSGADMAAITELVLNTYRVLLTRAKDSVHVWFKDPATRDHVRDVLGF